MANNEAAPTPILKKKQDDRIISSRRRSVSFLDNISIANSSSSSAGNVATSSESKTSSESVKEEHAGTTETDNDDARRNSLFEFSEYGLCYTPISEKSIPDTSNLPISSKLVFTNSCQRLELLALENSHNRYEILIIGDILHGRNLKTELEKCAQLHISVSIVATPTKEAVRTAHFILVLLPLEVVSSCNKFVSVLERLGTLRADYMLYCAAVGVTTSAGHDHYITELLNLHTLLLQRRLSYYLWCTASPGSWPGVVRKLLIELRSCVGLGKMPRAAMCSVLWPSDMKSYNLEQYLDQYAYRTSQGHDHA